MDPTVRLTWWEPYRLTAAASLAEVRTTGVARPMFWARVIAVCVLIIGALVAGSVYAFPNVVIPWTQLITGTILAPALIAGFIAIKMFVPCHVQVRREWIQFTRGDSAHRIPADRITAAEVTQGPSGPQLVVTYLTRKGTPRTRTCGLSAAVDTDTLTQLLRHVTTEARHVR